MRLSLRSVVLVSALFASIGASAVSGTACGDDTATVRQRLDSGLGDAIAQGDGGALACGVEVPTTYVSANFKANAAVELALAASYQAIIDKMIATEGTGTGTTTSAELKALYNDGAPSLLSVSSTDTQTVVDAMFTAFGTASGHIWTPEEEETDAGGAPVDAGGGGDDAGDGGDGGGANTDGTLTGGKYNNTFTFTPIGVDIRAYVEKVLLGSIYNHVLALVAAPITQATIDQLLASFGASPALANGAGVGDDADTLIAKFAANRDDKISSPPGEYRKIKSALLTLKAAVSGGEKCNADRDAAVATFLLEWEHTTYASAIYFLNASVVSAANPQAGPVTLRDYGSALGFVQSFRGLPSDKRKISDAQIDVLLGKMGSQAPYKLVTNAGASALSISDAEDNVALYEGFTSADVDAFKKSF